MSLLLLPTDMKVSEISPIFKNNDRLCKEIGRHINLLKIKSKLFENIMSDQIHHSDVTMGIMASQVTGVWPVCPVVCSDANQRKHQNSASLVFVRGLTGERWFTSQRASKAESFAISWRHHVIEYFSDLLSPSLSACRKKYSRQHLLFTCDWILASGAR